MVLEYGLNRAYNAIQFIEGIFEKGKKPNWQQIKARFQPLTRESEPALLPETQYSSGIEPTADQMKGNKSNSQRPKLYSEPCDNWSVWEVYYSTHDLYSNIPVVFVPILILSNVCFSQW